MKTNEFKKRQVKAILDTLKINNRDSLKNGIVQDGMLYFIGKGYFVLSIDLKDETLNGIIENQSLDVWYKLASGKDTLTTDDLVKMVDPSANNDAILNIKKIFTPDRSATEIISVDSKYLNVISRFLDDDKLSFKFNGMYSPITIVNNDIKDVSCVLMPLRIEGIK